LKKKILTGFIFIAIAWLFISETVASANGNNLLSLKGYIRAMPSLVVDRNYTRGDVGNTLHNRLNFRANLPWDISFVVEGRNRLIYSELLENLPGVIDLMGTDEGLIDMNWIWMNEGGWVGTTQIDRLFIDWQHDNWRIRAGRQRINWGITMVSNPNDLFNTYSFFDIDYPERPGADAVRLQYFPGNLSRLEFAYSPSRHRQQSVAALLYGFNRFNTDIQVITGYFRHRAALGLGWAGSIGGAGFKGEATWFYHIEEIPGRPRATLVAALGFDYMFANGTFVIAEALYNGGFTPTAGNIFMLTEPMRPDNIMLSKYAITLSATHSFSPVFNAGLSVMSLPDQKTVFVSPNLKYSLATDLDLEFVSQIFAGGQNTLFGQAGSSWFLVLQYSF